jgi:hypothetical protein
MLRFARRRLLISPEYPVTPGSPGNAGNAEIADNGKRQTPSGFLSTIKSVRYFFY